ncbi:MAG: methyltransferase domain-containing protein [Sporichthyaceae bacterium]|nr:methyltransferase domain-containing protein [Sporichthyaceae bacterium]
MTTEPVPTMSVQPEAVTDALRTLRDDAVRNAFELVEHLERMPPDEYKARHQDQLTAAADHARATMQPLIEWPGAAQFYLKIMTRDSNYTRVRRMLDFVLPGDRVLDIGSGRGYLSGVLLRDSALKTYTGIDIMDSHLASARSMIDANELGDRPAQFEVKNIYDLTPEWVAQHDPSLVIMLEMLEHLPDAEEGLATIAKCLPPDASLVFSVPLYGRLEKVWGHLSRFDVPRIRRMCEQAGLHIQHVEIIYGTWVLIMATTADVVDPRALYLARQEQPPASGRNTPIQEFVSVVTKRARLAKARGGARRVELRTEKDTTHVAVEGSRNPFGDQSGGLSFDLAGNDAVRLELEFEKPRNVRRVVVELVDDAGVPTARWVWRCGSPLRRSPFKYRRTFLLFPGQPARPFRPDGPVRDAVATRADVYIEVFPTRSAGFGLRRAAALRTRPA